MQTEQIAPLEIQSIDTNVTVAPVMMSAEDSLVDTITTKVPGRPTEITSQRQRKLLAQELKRQAGLLKKGRPVDPESERQQRLADLKERKEKGELKRGRPKYSEEEKIVAEQAKEQRKNQEQIRIQEAAKQLIASGKAIELLGEEYADVLINEEEIG